ncbi:IclR family transcriptional regulator [Nocardia terpenica]|uniref:Glycerol operon regulatory protein n=1 Tax=Nocardia terpenica TaxID=455432 RepID=A0A161X428_9NOCA|nr:IclR family transcriptional regulator [Nocardia terpenica]KZM71720.1 IclR family transcriptional regulator [Nocardia terpenica]MBF6063364.1 IclR family transcriptional regulator [Nocardia terpenica]MBF6105920.1 IclR family transcriptional regulator [Nocardia terpenica]MBF6113496.1 IclR family transcriptional regulator [Nocardia terpenica]MBF6119661.1 IclR family transcriptional regulator [Nocardia terpenica]
MPGPIQSIERAAAVLRLLARGPGRLGVAEIAGALGLPKPTVHGILRTLHGVGFVDQDPATGKYRLGTALLDLGAGYVDTNELRSRAINWADALAARTGESVRIAARVDEHVVVIHHVFRPDNSEQELAVGEQLPPHATALGKVLLAYDTDLAARVRAREPAPLTRRTITDRAVLGRVLAEVRQHGWAGDAGEFRPGEAGIAAPIRAHGGLVVGALGITGPLDRLCDTQLRPRPVLVGRVRDAARAVSRDLGAGQRLSTGHWTESDRG